MRLFVRHAVATVRFGGAYIVRTGRWWLPLLVAVLALTAIVVATVKVVVPTTVYTLF